MKKTIRIVFVCILGIALFAPLFHVAAALVNGSTIKSELEGANFQKPKLSLVGLLSNKTQDEIDDALVDVMPFHDDLVRMHADVQRSMIKPMAEMFGFDAYHT